MATSWTHSIYSARINDSGGRTITRRDTDGHTRTVAFIEGLRDWDRFTAALERGLNEVAAVHAIDTYELHADHVDQIRVALATSVREVCPWLHGDSGRYWATELWQIHRTMLALGIDSDD